MAFDFKKEYKEYYMPSKEPGIIEIPKMNFLAVRGKGNPNEEDGEYSNALELLYAVAYTLRMSYKGDYKISGYYEYVVPPLEGLWWQEGIKGYDMTKKEDFSWISLIRLPDFIKEEDFKWAIEVATKKKKKDFSKVEFFTFKEGKCVQAMHIGPYDREPETVSKMEDYAKEKGYEIDISDNRYHHEIYINDPRKTNPEKLKTVIRHPIKKKK